MAMAPSRQPTDRSDHPLEGTFTRGSQGKVVTLVIVVGQACGGKTKHPHGMSTSHRVAPPEERTRHLIQAVTDPVIAMAGWLSPCGCGSRPRCRRPTSTSPGGCCRSSGWARSRRVVARPLPGALALRRLRGGPGPRPVRGLTSLVFSSPALVASPIPVAACIAQACPHVPRGLVVPLVVAPGARAPMRPTGEDLDPASWSSGRARRAARSSARCCATPTGPTSRWPCSTTTPASATCASWACPCWGRAPRWRRGRGGRGRDGPHRHAERRWRGHPRARRPGRGLRPRGPRPAAGGRALRRADRQLRHPRRSPRPTCSAATRSTPTSTPIAGYLTGRAGAGHRGRRLDRLRAVPPDLPLRPRRAGHARPRRVGPPRRAAVDRGPGPARRPQPGRGRHPRRRAGCARCSPSTGPRWCSTPPPSSTCRCSRCTPARRVKTNVLRHPERCSTPAAASASSASSTSPPTRPPIPISVLGYTKRIAERLTAGGRRPRARRLPVSVRFGNVLGSRGSVLTTFRSPDRRRRPGHRHPPRRHPLLHDRRGGGAAGDPGRRHRPRRRGAGARHGRAGAHRRRRPAADRAVGPPRRDRLHRPAPRREAARGAARRRRGAAPDRPPADLAGAGAAPLADGPGRHGGCSHGAGRRRPRRRGHVR